MAGPTSLLLNSLASQTSTSSAAADAADIPMDSDTGESTNKTPHRLTADVHYTDVGSREYLQSHGGLDFGGSVGYNVGDALQLDLAATFDMGGKVKQFDTVGGQTLTSGYGNTLFGLRALGRFALPLGPVTLSAAAGGSIKAGAFSIAKNEAAPTLPNITPEACNEGAGRGECVEGANNTTAQVGLVNPAVPGALQPGDIEGGAAVSVCAVIPEISVGYMLGKAFGLEASVAHEKCHNILLPDNGGTNFSYGSTDWRFKLGASYNFASSSGSSDRTDHLKPVVEGLSLSNSSVNAAEAIKIKVTNKPEQDETLALYANNSTTAFGSITLTPDATEVPVVPSAGQKLSAGTHKISTAYTFDGETVTQELGNLEIKTSTTTGAVAPTPPQTPGVSSENPIQVKIEGTKLVLTYADLKDTYASASIAFKVGSQSYTQHIPLKGPTTIDLAGNSSKIKNSLRPGKEVKGDLRINLIPKDESVPVPKIELKDLVVKNTATADSATPRTDNAVADPAAPVVTRPAVPPADPVITPSVLTLADIKQEPSNPLKVAGNKTTGTFFYEATMTPEQASKLISIYQSNKAAYQAIPGVMPSTLSVGKNGAGSVQYIVKSETPTGFAYTLIKQQANIQADGSLKSQAAQPAEADSDKLSDLKRIIIDLSITFKKNDISISIQSIGENKYKITYKLDSEANAIDLDVKWLNNIAKRDALAGIINFLLKGYKVATNQ